MMEFFDVDLEDIQLFSCAVVGQEIYLDRNDTLSLVLPCYNAGHWENALNPVSITTFIDRTYIVLFDVVGYELTLTQFDSFMNPKECVSRSTLAAQLRKAHELDREFYIESLIYRDETLGHIWGPVFSKRCLVALPEKHQRLYRDDSLIRTYKTNRQELAFINGEELELEAFYAGLEAYVAK